ncbi:MAG: GvpL/GvpF family gas vesicle protein [Actinomycetota bacterium]|nr:GvpL/GvpF family gas vesicle protein [Actinomycetota bacterium]
MPEYVYGIVQPGAAAPSGRGIADAPLRLVAGDTACALVSDLPDAADLRLGREEMLAHARVLEEALTRGTVLPMRFGVLMDGPDAVRRVLLDDHGDELTDQLERLQGKVEMHVRGVYEEDALMREVVRDDARIASLRSTMQSHPEEATYHRRIELGELVAAAVERKRDSDAAGIIELLSPHAQAVEVGTPAHERVVLNASFLVSRDGLQRFDDVLEDIARDQADLIRFKCAGPLPPHSFVQLAESA